MVLITCILSAGPGRVSELIKECNEKLDTLKTKFVSRMTDNGVSILNSPFYRWCLEHWCVSFILKNIQVISIQKTLFKDGNPVSLQLIFPGAIQTCE